MRCGQGEPLAEGLGLSLEEAALALTWLCPEQMGEDQGGNISLGPNTPRIRGLELQAPIQFGQITSQTVSRALSGATDRRSPMPGLRRG